MSSTGGFAGEQLRSREHEIMYLGLVPRETYCGEPVDFD